MGPEGFVTAWFVLALVFAAMGAFVGGANDRELAGALLGFLIGPFGVVAVAAMTPSRRMAAEERQKLAEDLARVLVATREEPQGRKPPRGKPRESRHSTPATAVDDDDPSASRLAADILRTRTTLDQDHSAETQEPAPATGRTPDTTAPSSEPFLGLPEGFYVDPLDETRERYWGGDAWDTVTYVREKKTREATPTTDPGLPPGYYPDPANPARDRYWRGDRWDSSSFLRES